MSNLNVENATAAVNYIFGLKGTNNVVVLFGKKEPLVIQSSNQGDLLLVYKLDRDGTFLKLASKKAIISHVKKFTVVGHVLVRGHHDNESIMQELKNYETV